MAGHICLDITPVFANTQKIEVDNLLVPGKLVQMKEADIHTGGAVANTGLAMKILGINTILMGKVGDDDFGDLILNILKKYGQDDHMIVSKESTTSYSIVLAPVGIDRIFLHNSGANETFSLADMDLSVVEESSFFHFGYPPLMKHMYQNNGEELVFLFRYMKKHNLITSLDMAMVDAASEAGQVDWLTILTNVLPYVDFFLPSIEELGYMLKRDQYKEWLVRASNGDITEILSIKEDVKPLADLVINMGAKVVLIKCGVPGMYYKTSGVSQMKQIVGKQNYDFISWADKEGFQRSYVPDRVLSATGAGDTSIAAFLTAVISGYSLENCLKLAAATGACCVSEYDALSGLRPLDDLMKKIDQGWEQQNSGQDL